MNHEEYKQGIYHKKIEQEEARVRDVMFQVMIPVLLIMAGIFITIHFLIYLLASL